MKKYLIILFGLICQLSLFSQINHTQELMDLVAENRWIEAEQYYAHHSDSIFYEPVEYAYKGGVSKAFNKPHEAIEYFNYVLDKYQDNMEPLALFITFIYAPLRECYLRTNDFENANRILDIVEEIIKNDTTLGLTEENKLTIYNKLGKDRQRYNYQQQYPSLRVDFGESGTTTIPFDNSVFGLIRSEIKCNNYSAQAIYDTGAQECSVSRDAAEKLNITIFEDAHWLINGNGKAKMGMIDSLQIGTITVYNVLVFINEEERDGMKRMIDEDTPDSMRQVQLDRIDKFISSKDIIIGLPILNMLRKIELDYINKALTFSNNSQQNNSEKNLALHNGGLYLSFTVNSNPQLYTALFDTGGSHGLDISNQFLVQNKEFFDTSIAKEDLRRREMLGQGLASNKLYLKPQGLYMKVGTERIDLTDQCMINEKDYLNKNTINRNMDIGITTFDRCKNMTIDFENMCLSVEK